MIVLLAKRPELQKSLQKEVDRAIGSDREPSLSDRENCHLTEAFVLETLRYISHVPLSIFHAASEQVTIKGYTLQKNTVVSIQLAFNNIKFREAFFSFEKDIGFAHFR